MGKEVRDGDGVVYVEKKPWYKKVWVWILGILLALLIVIVAGVGAGTYAIFKSSDSSTVSSTRSSSTASSRTASSTSASSTENHDEVATADGKGVSKEEFQSIMDGYDNLNKHIKELNRKVDSMSEAEKQNASIDLLQEQNAVTALQVDLQDELSASQTMRITNKSVNILQSYEELSDKLN
ncbi:hypothetical protein [Weissella minor]|uniref:Uncharacterized protein n=1 Tax=Weissella minor TaxID=1620 RepID=A0A0R2JI43_9LACO|nr:hypothetical protein [Weissella minor]KRN76959.1 hypothetical protein IV67_GL000471 [Weissella minor]